MSMTKSKVYSLENSDLSVEVMPSEGGRISSLRSLCSGLEFLTQSRRSGGYPQAGLDTRFQDGPCAGIEECLPTVGPSGPETAGGPAPDHGDFWQLPWQVLAVSDKDLKMSRVGFSRTLHFSKQLSLQGDTLRVAYRVENSGSTTQSFLYACHPLFAVSAGDRVFLPRGIRELRLDYSKRDRLGVHGTIVNWPVMRSGLRLDLAFGPEAATAEMFYSPRLSEGVCGIYREASGQVLELSFDSERLPFLGLWLCYGGWPNEGNGPFQYAVALEPTTAPCNTLSKAQQISADISLDPGEIFDWEILFSVREPGQRTFYSTVPPKYFRSFCND
jgi:galactose mutarotase-like enzyme